MTGAWNVTWTVGRDPTDGPLLPGCPGDQVRVAIYVRSRGNVHESRTSARHQRDQLRAVLNAHDGWRLVRTYADCRSANAVHPGPRRGAGPGSRRLLRPHCFESWWRRSGSRTGGSSNRPSGYPSGRFLYSPDWWAALDSNQVPPRYQHGALPVELAARGIGRGGRIRTLGPRFWRPML